MGISGILGFVGAAGWVLAVLGVAIAVMTASQSRSPRNGITLAIVGVVVGILFTVIGQGVIIVQPQEVAVVFDTITGNLLEPRTPGINIVIPVIQEATIYSIERQEYTMSGATNEGRIQGDDAIQARTADGQEVQIEATLIYRISPEEVNLIHQNWQQRYTDGLVHPTMRGVIRDEVALYGVEEVYSTQRAAMRDGIQQGLEERLEREGLEIIDFLIRDVQFSPEYAESVEQKQIAEQDRLRAEQEAERLRVQAQGERDAAVFRAEGERLSTVERATGNAESVRINAEAEADAILLRAQADSQALALINEQISQNPALIQWRYVDTLADNVQLMLLPSDSPFLFDFESLASQSALGTPAQDDVEGTDTQSMSDEGSASSQNDAPAEPQSDAPVEEEAESGQG
jgi:regulator of protease activity HflC (stomatin/prohibitin superfamily)